MKKSSKGKKMTLIVKPYGGSRSTSSKGKRSMGARRSKKGRY